MRYFGKNYGAPIYEDAEQVPAPVGELCVHCGEAITDGDDGFVLPGAGLAPYHRACFLRGIIGSVAHVQHRCSCFVPGSSENDPPGMTRREAAEAAVSTLERAVESVRGGGDHAPDH
jgi:hypothetical protein